jgi:hypothetical protein
VECDGAVGSCHTATVLQPVQHRALSIVLVAQLGNPRGEVLRTTALLITTSTEHVLLPSGDEEVLSKDTPRFPSGRASSRGAPTVAFVHPTIFTGSEIPSADNAGSPVPTIQCSVLEFVFDTTWAVANLISSGRLKRYPGFPFSHDVW